MKDHKQIIDELNSEPMDRWAKSRWIKSTETTLRFILLVLLTIVSVGVLIFQVLKFEEVIDTAPSHVIELIIFITSLLAFGLWAIWGRKR